MTSVPDHVTEAEKIRAAEAQSRRNRTRANLDLIEVLPPAGVGLGRRVRVRGKIRVWFSVALIRAYCGCRWARLAACRGAPLGKCQAYRAGYRLGE